MAIVATSHVDADMDVSRGLKKGKKGNSAKAMKSGKRAKKKRNRAPTMAPVAGTTSPTMSAYPTSAPVPTNDNDSDASF